MQTTYAMLHGRPARAVEQSLASVPSTTRWLLEQRVLNPGVSGRFEMSFHAVRSFTTAGPTQRFRTGAADRHCGQPDPSARSATGTGQLVASDRGADHYPAQNLSLHPELRERLTLPTDANLRVASTTSLTAPP